MTGEETAAVLAVFGANWPRVTISEQTVFLWIAQCGAVDVTDGKKAAELLIRNEEFWPALSEFLKTASGCAQRRRMEASGRGLPSAERRASPEFVKDTVAEIRAKLRGDA